MRPADTSPEAWKVFIDLHRAMAPGEKMRQILDYSWFLFKMSEAVLKAENPEMTDREVFLRVAARRLDEQTMIRVYGWNPRTGEYVSQSDSQGS
jgi:hypothetical protein